MTLNASGPSQRALTSQRALIRRRVAILVVMAAAVALFFALGLNHDLTIAELKARRADLAAFYAAHPVQMIAMFMLAEVTALTLLLPGAVAPFAIAAGAVFGPVTGTLIVLGALTIGDSLSFLIARYLLRHWAERWFGGQAERFRAGMKRHGAFYLLSLRLMAVVPYFVVTLAMGLTRMRLRVYSPVSLLGLIPPSAVYIAAGTQLGRISQPSDVLSPGLLATFGLLAAVPLLFRFLFRSYRREDAREEPSRKPLADGGEG